MQTTTRLDKYLKHVHAHTKQAHWPVLKYSKSLRGMKSPYLQHPEIAHILASSVPSSGRKAVARPSATPGAGETGWHSASLAASRDGCEPT